MDKHTYLRECLFRHPQFQAEMLAFHQRFPILLELWPRVPAHPPLEALPTWAHALIEERGPRLLAIIPRTLQDINRQIPGYLFAMLLMEFPQYRFLYPVGAAWNKRYFDWLGCSAEDIKQAIEELRRHWPTVPEVVLRWGQLEQAPRPALVMKPQLYVSDTWKNWGDDLVRLASAREVVGFIPVYADTTLEDIRAQWSHVQEAQRGRSAPRRARPDSYAVRLQVWDLYQDSFSFADVARRLNLRPTTVKGLYLQVACDILGSGRPVRTHRARVLAHDDPTSHVQRCPTCQKAVRFEDLCRWAQEHVAQDHVAQRERPTPRD